MYSRSVLNRSLLCFVALLCILAFLFILKIMHMTQDKEFRNEYYRAGNKFYIIEFFNMMAGWEEADSYCRRKNGQLMNVDNADELEAFNRLLIHLNYPNGTTFVTAGYETDRNKPDQPIGYYKWLQGEPTMHEKHWISLLRKNDQLYMKMSDGNDDYFVCELKDGNVSLIKRYLGKKFKNGFETFEKAVKQFV